MNKRGRPPHPDILTPREWEVLALMRDGLSNDEIAARLGVSVAGAKFHVSEIIGKLGVRDRHEAARWQPDETSRSRLGALGPLAALRRLRVSSAATPLGAATLAITLVAIGALTWGVIATRDGTSSDGRWAYADAQSGSPSVILFDLSKHRARRIRVPDNVRSARWVKPGETFIAQGDAAPDDYSIFGLDGRRVPTPLLQDQLTRDVVPAPDGSALLVGRTDNQYLVSEFPDGGGSTFLTGTRNLAFSADGKRIAYTTVGGSDKDGQNHDWRSIIVGEKSELTGYNGSGLAIQSQREADGLMELPPDPWSPDGNYLLVERFGPCDVVTPDPGHCYGMPTFEVYGAQVTGKIFWNAYAGRLRAAQWAGPGRLFLTFFPEAEYDPDFPDAQSLIVDLGLQKQPAPTVFQGSCCVSFSPDGHYAIVPHGAGHAASQRCSLVDASTGAEIAGFDAAAADAYGWFCGSASWTADSTMALVSPSGGN